LLEFYLIPDCHCQYAVLNICQFFSQGVQQSRLSLVGKLDGMELLHKILRWRKRNETKVMCQWKSRGRRLRPGKRNRDQGSFACHELFKR